MGVEPLEPLLDALPAAPGSLPESLAAAYGGGLEMPETALYANFVSSLDGVAALPEPGLSSGAALSGRAEGDRFLMGLLRAFASVVLIGAGTLRADAGHLWTPAYIHPPSARGFAELRRRLGLPPEPALAVVTAGGELDLGQRGLRGGIVITSRRGLARLAGSVAANVELVEAGAERVTPADLVAALRARGHRRILTEGGPHLIGELVGAGLLEELFLTLSPVLAGHGEGRLGLMEGLPLAPPDFAWGRLRSARRQGSHLFLRYRLERA